MRTTVKVRQIFKNIKSQMLLIENLFLDLDIDITKTYILELKEIRSKRTLQQNKMMWALIRKIASHEDMQQEPEEIYISERMLPSSLTDNSSCTQTFGNVRSTFSKLSNSSLT